MSLAPDDIFDQALNQARQQTMPQAQPQPQGDIFDQALVAARGRRLIPDSTLNAIPGGFEGGTLGAIQNQLQQPAPSPLLQNTAPDYFRISQQDFQDAYQNSPEANSAIAWLDARHNAQNVLVGADNHPLYIPQPDGSVVVRREVYDAITPAMARIQKERNPAPEQSLWQGLKNAVPSAWAQGQRTAGVGLEALGQATGFTPLENRGQDMQAHAQQVQQDNPVQGMVPQAVAGGLGLGVQFLEGMGTPVGFTGSFAANQFLDTYKASINLGDDPRTAGGKGLASSIVALLTMKLGHVLSPAQTAGVVDKAITGYMTGSGILEVQGIVNEELEKMGTGQKVDLSGIVPSVLSQGPLMGAFGAMHGGGEAANDQRLTNQPESSGVVVEKRAATVPLENAGNVNYPPGITKSPPENQPQPPVDQPAQPPQDQQAGAANEQGNGVEAGAHGGSVPPITLENLHNFIPADEGLETTFEGKRVRAVNGRWVEVSTPPEPPQTPAQPGAKAESSTDIPQPSTPVPPEQSGQPAESAAGEGAGVKLAQDSPEVQAYHSGDVDPLMLWLETHDPKWNDLRNQQDRSHEGNKQDQQTALHAHLDHVIDTIDRGEAYVPQSDQNRGAEHSGVEGQGLSEAPSPGDSTPQLEAPRQAGKPKSKAAIERELLDHYNQTEGAANAQQDLHEETMHDEQPGATTFGGKYPEDVRNAFTKEEFAQLQRRGIVRLRKPGDQVGWEDAVHRLGGIDKYNDMLRRRLEGSKAGRLRAAVEHAKSSGNPELRALAYEYTDEVDPEAPRQRVPENGPSSIKNAVTAKEREARNLPPAEEAAKRDLGTVWDAAKKEAESSSTVQDDLISELKKKPRALTDREDALLLHRQIALQNEHRQLSNQMVEASESGDAEGRLPEIRQRLAGVSDRLLDVYNVNKSSGTETGRGLNARRLMAKEDYSLAAMEVSKRAAKGGGPLTEAEHAKLNDLHAKIEQTQKALDDYIARAQKTQGRVTEIKAKSSTYGAKNKLVTADSYKAALDTLKSQKLYSLETIVGEKLPALLKIAAYHVEAGARSFAAFAVKMKRDVGDEIEPYLKDLHEHAVAEVGDSEQIQKQRTATLERTIQQLQQRLIEIRAGKVEGKGADRQPLTQVQAELAAKKAELRKQLLEAKAVSPEYQKKAAETQSAASLKAAKTRTTNRIHDLAQRMVDEDYEPNPPAKPIALDAEGQRLKAEAERMKIQFQNALMLDRLKRRGAGEKVADWASAIVRANVLSRPSTLLKLTAAAAQRMVFTPLEELVGAGYSKVFKRLADQAPREGGLSIRAEAKSLTEGFTQGMRDMWLKLKTGKSNLDVLHGDMEKMPSTFLDFIGHLHGAIKAPVQRAEFARSMQKRMEFGIRNGVKVNDLLVQTRMAADAYKDAQRSIFQQDNRVTSAYNNAIRDWESPDKTTGKPTALGKAGATALKIAFPVVKVPTNVVGEALTYALGSVSGGRQLIKAYRAGIEKLSPDQADSIMRQLKKGSLGAAVMLLGYYNANNIGGYYQHGQKRDDEDVKPGQVRLFGHDIPKLLLHNPLTETLQVGATIGRVADSRLHKKDGETQGISSGVASAAMGLAEETPFLGPTAQNIFEVIREPAKRGDIAGREIAGRVIPGAVDEIAKMGDKNSEGEPIKRQPHGFGEQFKMSIPGLRQQVDQTPEKLERMNTPEHETHIANSAKVFGPLYGAPVEKAMQIYGKMSDADKAKYSEPLRYKIAHSQLTPAEKTRLIGSIK